ncbi:hypothetical protein SPRG_15826 [Saprolegnia parasitica CBS 223.65]|uniref:Uncharacterized protein n=1 Tax=Saprolegnia parasitica (strain CBS 223.65) TaxID=695850 RepID=A0A067BL26_SAPPC|nr:hypothetical protein SPRG_15826 [Saprolegnia parasitica CBS 223.65]KDO18903.1 hypothetical protein SPRG_15826 [Saprolegnia parasitica CBS 223.65]|eukprot:XP_012210396.1 hypothetical protein SPRG_15826 [Saprolegnia parasitica CBS 223.65]
MSTASYSPASPTAPKKKGERTAWTKEQVEALKNAVTEFEATHPGGVGRGKWKAIAANVPGRNDAQCRQRWEDSTKEGRKEGTWTSTEDNALRMAVEATKNVTWRRWTMVAERIPSRTAKQCEYRYKNHLAPKSGRTADSHGTNALSFMAEVTMGQKKLQPNAAGMMPTYAVAPDNCFMAARSMPPLGGAHHSYYNIPAAMPPINDGNVKESLTTAIQALQPLLTKTVVAAYPSHILDLAVQCIAALPAETSAVVREVQKLRYVLAEQMPCRGGAPSMTHSPYGQPYAPSVAQPQPIAVAPRPGMGNPAAASTPIETIDAPYTTVSHPTYPAVTTNGVAGWHLPTPLVDRMQALTEASTTMPPTPPAPTDQQRVLSIDGRPKTKPTSQPVTFVVTNPATESLRTSSDLPLSTPGKNSKHVGRQPTTFTFRASESTNGIRVMPAITPECPTT